MSWLVLFLGVALWWGAHLFKRVAPDRRGLMPDSQAKGMVTFALVLSIVLMVVGFRAATVVEIWNPPSFLRHLNNLIVLIAIYLMSPAPKKGKLVSGLRHPMLLGFSLWAIAHLLVNGDLAAMLLFGGLLGWSLITPGIINRAEPDWTAPEPGPIAKDAMFLGASVVLLLVIGFIHGWLGYPVFGS
ncbi:NnrU family protein [Tropicimonas sp. TH_r6]|uniref:NnrU family protein n=1 Tax=Tropicimonas sp. TH_r6 TaxID=3082085 RepID=UPI0029555AEC|nr:NnrU family protein [Tropicimonas sp. TH_r6]MDV7145200.1 NnrU family protein [Tropicimonas sp. TH_r6]